MQLLLLPTNSRRTQDILKDSAVTFSEIFGDHVHGFFDEIHSSFYIFLSTIMTFSFLLHFQETSHSSNSPR